MRNELEFILRGGVVKRFHTLRTLHTQSVAEHSFGVAWLCWLLCDGKPSAALLMAALSHDIAEHTTGDLPAPAKRRMSLGRLFANEESRWMAASGIVCAGTTVEEEDMLKLADILDLLLFCIQELEFGNHSMAAVYRRGLDYICEMGELSDTAKELLTIIGERYGHASGER